MTIFHHVNDADLQGVPAIPTPHDAAGPTYDGPHFVPYDREADEDVPCLYAGSGYDSNSERHGI